MHPIVHLQMPPKCPANVGKAFLSNSVHVVQDTKEQVKMEMYYRGSQNKVLSELLLESPL